MTDKAVWEGGQSLATLATVVGAIVALVAAIVVGLLLTSSGTPAQICLILLLPLTTVLILSQTRVPRLIQEWQISHEFDSSISTGDDLTLTDDLAALTKKAWEVLGPGSGGKSLDYALRRVQESRIADPGSGQQDCESRRIVGLDVAHRALAPLDRSVLTEVDNLCTGDARWSSSAFERAFNLFRRWMEVHVAIGRAFGEAIRSSLSTNHVVAIGHDEWFSFYDEASYLIRETNGLRDRAIKKLSVAKRPLDLGQVMSELPRLPDDWVRSGNAGKTE